LYITVQPFADSKPLTVHAQTPYKHFKNGRVWSQWLTLPVNYSSLPANTLLAITAWDVSAVNPNGGDDGHHIPFGGTTIPLFDENATLRTGRQKCRIWRHKAADGYSDTTTPWREPKKRGRRGTEEDAVVVDGRHANREAEVERLSDLIKKQELGEIPENKWLDQMVFRQIEKLEKHNMRDAAKPRVARKADTNGNGDSAQLCAESDPDHVDGAFYLYLEFPRFDHPIVFTDHEYPPPPMSSLQPASSQPGAVNFKPPPEVQLGPGIHAEDKQGDASSTSRLFRIYDPEIGYADNPAENKHRRLIRGQRNALDRDLKPNPKMRDFLNKIMSYGPTVELSEKEKDEVWRFRHHLTKEKRALTKLVKSVNWNEQAESRQAIALLPKWVEIDVDDALELLGPSVRNPAVRAYAVDRLRKADDDELLLYLLQLVQALKFEPPLTPTDEDELDSSLASFVIARSAANLTLSNFLYWYLMVEMEDQNESNRKLFARVSYDFMKELERSEEGRARRKVLLRQAEFITVLSKISKDVVNSRADRTKRIEQLKKFLADPKNDLLAMDPPLPLPLDPSVSITGAIPDDANVFKSSLYPLYINFKTSTGEKYPFMFKTGDDLRQDQLVIQIIALMDRLLMKENLDLKLTPYRILATSTLAGAVQFVPSTAISAILGNPKYKSSILGFLRFHNPAASSASSADSVLGVRKEAMDTYVKSVAGYCVITYLLGVGDRHLDNLLLTPDGHFLHIDYGYILGRDPKPMAPLMKLSSEMIDGMGGVGSRQYEEFRQYAFTAYTTLRRSSSLILNLFSLMQDAGIPGLAVYGADAVGKVEERFKLEVDEGEAVAFLGQLIEREMGNWGGVVIDRLHGLVQGWRA
jgi:phosphatidylinositol 3-kinase